MCTEQQFLRLYCGFVALIVTASYCGAPSFAAESLTSSESVPKQAGGGPDNNPLRIEQAKKLLRDSRAFTAAARIYLAQADQSIKDAKRLQGEAHQYGKNLQLTAPLLKGKNLQYARQQFQMDLNQFAKHAKEYKLHTEAVRQQFGHCQASLTAYEKHKRDLELHCDQFHLPDIEPPHICLEVTTSAQEAASLQNRVAEQGKRVAEAEMQLMKAEARLKKAALISDSVESELALREQDLAAEFARLKEEHRQLDVGRRAIQRSGGKIGVPQVRGTIKTK